MSYQNLEEPELEFGENAFPDFDDEGLERFLNLSRNEQLREMMTEQQQQLKKTREKLNEYRSVLGKERFEELLGLFYQEWSTEHAIDSIESEMRGIMASG